MIRQYHQLNGYEFEQTPGDSGRQRSLACCTPWGHKEWDTSWQCNIIKIEANVLCQGLPQWLGGKEPNVKKCGFNSWVRKISWKRARQPSPVFLLGESHEQRNLVGYSPWGCTELDTTCLPKCFLFRKLKLLRVFKNTMRKGPLLKGCKKCCLHTF